MVSKWPASVVVRRLAAAMLLNVFGEAGILFSFINIVASLLI